jgi:hypothetical protein
LSLLRGWCVVYVGDASVSLRLLLLVSSSWLVLSMLEMQVSLYLLPFHLT